MFLTLGMSPIAVVITSWNFSAVGKGCSSSNDVKINEEEPSITPRKDKVQPLIRQQSTFSTSKDKGKDDTSAKTIATHIVPESFSNSANVANSPENSTT